MPYLRLPLVSGLFATEDRERALSHNDPSRLSHLGQVPEPGAAPCAASKVALFGAAVRDVLWPMLAARLSKCPVPQSVVQSMSAALTRRTSAELRGVLGAALGDVVSFALCQELGMGDECRGWSDRLSWGASSSSAPRWAACAAVRRPWRRPNWRSLPRARPRCAAPCRRPSAEGAVVLVLATQHVRRDGDLTPLAAALEKLELDEAGDLQSLSECLLKEPAQAGGDDEASATSSLEGVLTSLLGFSGPLRQLGTGGHTTATALRAWKRKAPQFDLTAGLLQTFGPLGALFPDVVQPLVATKLQRLGLLAAEVRRARRAGTASRPALLMALLNGTSCLCGQARTSRRPVPMLWQ